MKQSSKLFIFVSLLLVLGLLFAALPTGQVQAQTTPQVVYDAIPATLAPSYPSQPFQAQQTFEFGDYVNLAGVNRNLRTISVTMVTWAYQSSNSSFGDATGWDYPITLNIYNVVTGTSNTLGSLIGTKTQTFHLPWRPEPDLTNCPDEPGKTNRWYNASDTSCNNGYAFNITFDLSTSNITLPDAVVLGIAYNTMSYGVAPMGVTGPYDSLNVSAIGSQTVGTDGNTDRVFWNTITADWYTDKGLAGVGVFREDTNWTGYGTIPFQITADPTPVVQVWNLQPSWDAPGGGGVFSAYVGPTAYGYVSPGKTQYIGSSAPFGAQYGIIKAGITPDPTSGNYEDEGLFGFKPAVTIDVFAAKPLTYVVRNVTGTNPVWMTIEVDTGVPGDRSDNTTYQHVPAPYPAGVNTVNAGAGLWQKWNNADGDVTGNTPISLSQIAADNAGKDVVRAYLRLGMGNSYNVSPGVGTVAGVDKVSMAGVVYDFAVVYPSTNDLNRAKTPTKWAHVNLVSVDALAQTATFELVQNRAFLSCVEYRTSLETTPTDTRANFNTKVLDGMWHFTCGTTVGSTPITVALGTAKSVEFRLAFGAEEDERFYWTQFTLVPEVWIDDDYTPATPGWGVDHFLTIPEGINAVSPGGIVHVESGTYTSELVIKKALTLVATNGPATTIINGGATLTNTSPGLYVVTIDASNVIMDGFTVTNPLFNSTWQSDPIGIVVGIYTNNDLSNIRVTNNIVTKTTDPNFIVNYNAPHGIVVNGVVAGLEIDHNVVHDLASVVTTSGYGGTTGIALYGYDTEPLSTNVSIHDNEVYDIRVVNTGTGVAVPRGIRTGWGAGTATISANYVHDIAGIGIQTNVYTNEAITITGNTITNTSVGVSMEHPSGGTIVGNNVFGNQIGIKVTGSTTAGIHFNRIFGNVNGGLLNTSAAIVAAENNWWGCNAGPNDAAAKCDTTANTGTGTITSTPWLILQTLAVPTSVDPNGTAAITASLRTNSALANTSTDGYLINGLPVAFTATSIGGTVNPTSGSTLDGQATTVFTATALRGTYEVCSVVDNQNTCSPITVHNQAPMAVDDAYETDQDTTLSVDVAIGVLVNDSDPDKDTKTATLVSDVSHGSLTLFGDGSFIYTPAPGFFGTDTFTYQLVTYQSLAMANYGWTDEAVVTITVNEVPADEYFLYLPLISK